MPSAICRLPWKPRRRPPESRATRACVVYHRPGEEPENLFWARGPAQPAAQALDWTQLPDPAFLYLWSPGAGLTATQ